MITTVSKFRFTLGLIAGNRKCYFNYKLNGILFLDLRVRKYSETLSDQNVLYESEVSNLYLSNCPKDIKKVFLNSNLVTKRVFKNVKKVFSTFAHFLFLQSACLGFLGCFE